MQEHDVEQIAIMFKRKETAVFFLLSIMLLVVTGYLIRWLTVKIREFENDCETWLKSGSVRFSYENEEIPAADETASDDDDPLIHNE